MLLDGKKCLSWMAHGCEEVAALIANLILMLFRKSGMDGRPRPPLLTGEKVLLALIVACLGYKNFSIIFSIRVI